MECPTILYIVLYECVFMNKKKLTVQYSLLETASKQSKRDDQEDDDPQGPFTETNGRFFHSKSLQQDTTVHVFVVCEATWESCLRGLYTVYVENTKRDMSESLSSLHTPQMYSRSVGTQYLINNTSNKYDLQSKVLVIPSSFMASLRSMPRFLTR